MERLWQYYTTPPVGGEAARYTQEQFDWSSSSFLKPDDIEQCEHFANLYFEALEGIKSKFHKDYAAIFFVNLSPSFLGRKEDLEKQRRSNQEQ